MDLASCASKSILSPITKSYSPAFSKFDYLAIYSRERNKNCSNRHVYMMIYILEHLHIQCLLHADRIVDSQSDLHTSSISITRKLVMSANSWIPPQTYWIRNFGGEAMHSMFEESLPVILMLAKVWEPPLWITDQWEPYQRLKRILSLCQQMRFNNSQLFSYQLIMGIDLASCRFFL